MPHAKAKLKKTRYLHPWCQQSLVQKGAPEVLPPQGLNLEGAVTWG